MRVRSLGQEEPLEMEIATHSSILAWEIPWAEEAGGLQFKRARSCKRARQDWKWEWWTEIRGLVENHRKAGGVTGPLPIPCRWTTPPGLCPSHSLPTERRCRETERIFSGTPTTPKKVTPGVPRNSAPDPPAVKLQHGTLC